MRYYARYANGVLHSIGIGLDGVEITKEEYETLSNEIHEKCALVDALYSGEITIEEIPIEWREEIQRRVDERIAQQGTAEDQDISADEALEIILGGEV